MKNKVIFGCVGVLCLVLIFNIHTSGGINGTDDDENIKVQRSYRKDISHQIKKEGDLPDGTFYQEVIVETAEHAVLLLHGAAFTSQTWADLGTLDELGSNGISAVAIDIPHFGRSKSLSTVSNPVDYLDSVILNFESLRSAKLIIISPSMSGSISLPYLFERQSKLSGYVPVAPVSANQHSPAEYKKIQIPTLIVYGEKDLGLGQKGATYLSNIPNSKELIIPNGKHPCYLDDPELWHKNLIQFVKSI